MNKNNPRFLKVRWVDHTTPEPKKTADFYSELLGFVQDPVDEGNGKTSYSMNDTEGNEIFGIVDEEKFKDWPSTWVVYFEVENFEETCKNIENLGGEILIKKEKSCLMKDPSGAPILISPEYKS